MLASHGRSQAPAHVRQCASGSTSSGGTVMTVPCERNRDCFFELRLEKWW